MRLRARDALGSETVVTYPFVLDVHQPPFVRSDCVLAPKGLSGLVRLSGLARGGRTLLPQAMVSGSDEPVDALFSRALVGFLFIALSIPLILRKVPPNAWYGLRLPGTMRSEAVWYEANGRSGRDLCGLGIIVIAVAVALWGFEVHDLTGARIMAGVVLVGALGLLVRGFQHARSTGRPESSS